MRARKRKVAQPVAAAVEPTITRSRAVITLATSHAPQAAERGRKRNVGRPRASGDPLMTSQAVDDCRPVADRDLLPVADRDLLAAYTVPRGMRQMTVAPCCVQIRDTRRQHHCWRAQRQRPPGVAGKRLSSSDCCSHISCCKKCTR